MTEISKNFGVNNNTPAFKSSQVSGAGVSGHEVREEMPDYRTAAGAPALETAGRVQAGSVDGVNHDIAFILKNPQALEMSEALFNAAEEAGVPYAEAATFATSEVR